MTIAIIGGGAAGLMAAATIAEQRPDITVILIEKNDGLGKKVLISGGGRCNVTTGLSDIRTVLTKYPRGGKFLNSAMRVFPPDAVYSWFEAHGVPLKIEEDMRVFPQSNNGADVLAAFERIFEAAGTGVWLNCDVVRIEKKEEEGFRIFFKHDEILEADKVIFTTGGQAFRHTGSTGDGYTFAEALGHHVTPLAPSLGAFFVKEEWPKTLSGLSFEKVTFSTKFEKKYEFTGPFLFTHRGVSGPAVFALSSLVAFEPCSAAQPMTVMMDMFPDVREEKMREQLETAARENAKKSVANLLHLFMPKSLATVIAAELKLKESNAGDISKKDVARIVAWLKHVPLTVIARGGGDEFVTAGGVMLSEVDQRTMESKIVPGIFFAGEILDIDGFTGGYNLQASWATGRAAGDGALNSLS